VVFGPFSGVHLNDLTKPLKMHLNMK
jgi:hypothetical protein